VFSELLARIAEALDSAKIRYMVIGGQAVILYGEPRATKDIDITLGAGIDRLGDVERAVASLGLRPLVDPATFTQETMVLPCADPSTGIRIDFILSNSEYERQALGRARAVRLEGADVRFASVEDLIVHKIVAGRARDLEDVRRVLSKNPAADTKYIESWLEKFSATLGEPLLKRFRDILSPS